MSDMSHYLATLVVLAFAVARMTRIIVDDTVALQLRFRVASRFGATHPATLFVHCPWCVGWWMSTVAVAAAWLAGQLPVHSLLQLAAVPAVAQLAALIRANTESR